MAQIRYQYFEIIQNGKNMGPARLHRGLVMTESRRTKLDPRFDHDLIKEHQVRRIGTYLSALPARGT